MTATAAVVASGGALGAVIAATALAGGAGAALGSALAILVGDHHARYLQEQFDHGGLLLWVYVRDPERERNAVRILAKHSGQDVHVHAIRA